MTINTKSINLILFFLCLFFVATVPAQDQNIKQTPSEKTLSVAEQKKDLAILKRTLQTMHPGIYRYQTAAAVEKEFSRVERQLDRPLPTGDFLIVIAQFVNQARCGHTYVNPYNQRTEIVQQLFDGRSYLPFYFRIINNKIIVTENASPANLAHGSEITRINGATSGAIIEKLLTVSKADGFGTLGHRINNLELRRIEAEHYALFDLYFPLFFPLQNDVFSIEAIDYATKKKVRFQVPAMLKDERTKAMTERYGASPTYDDGWRFSFLSDATALLKIDNSLTWRLKQIKFKEFLADAFKELKVKRTANLIVDLRGNGGGDMDVGYELSRYLAKERLPVYADRRRFLRNVAAQPDLVKYLETYSDYLKAALKTGFPVDSYQKADGDYYAVLKSDNTSDYSTVVPDPNSFTGKTYIIADASNASATYQFLDYAQANKLATIVGQPTGGNKQGINGDNYFFLYLPHSKIETDLPVYYQAPLVARRKDEGVIPEIIVKEQPSDVGERFDRELEAVKRLINWRL